MDVEDLILIRGFSKLAICRSRLTASNAGGGKGSIKTQQTLAQPSPRSLRRSQQCSVLLGRQICCAGERRALTPAWGTAPVLSLEPFLAPKGPRDAVPSCWDLSGQHPGTPLWDWDGGDGEERSRGGVGSKPTGLGTLLKPPQWAPQLERVPMPPAPLWVPCAGLGAPPCSVGRSGRLPGLTEAFRILCLGFSIQAAKQKSHYSPAQRQRPRAWLGAGAAWGEGVQECGKGPCPPCTPLQCPTAPCRVLLPQMPPSPCPSPGHCLQTWLLLAPGPPEPLGATECLPALWGQLGVRVWCRSHGASRGRVGL